MRTLLFCTAYAWREEFWRLRFRRWLNAVRTNGVRADTILIIDDGSPTLPYWPDVSVVTSINAIGTTSLFHFHQRLGRQARTIYPGWFRSFCLAGRIAEQLAFDKVIHLESDAFAVSPRMADWLNDFAEGWGTPFCARHRLPEAAIQVIAGNAMRTYIELARRPYSDFTGYEAEWFLPFTHVDKDLVGDRHGERGPTVPRDADWTTQVHPSTSREYFWWLPDEACSDLL